MKTETVIAPKLAVHAEPFFDDGLIFGSIVRCDSYRDSLGQLQFPPLDWGWRVSSRRSGPRAAVLQVGWCSFVDCLLNL